ncbi:outer membrane lipoprotein carrier protein LolA [candidate division WOR-3 bacterium]|nr:outer membrane lipoprotein carrier protein LolA [candidate division WOR-3 bacterium]
MLIVFFLMGLSPATDSLFNYLDRIDYFESQYEEIVFDSLTESEFVFRGRIFLARPCFFRMNVTYPEIQTLICDGDFLLLDIPSDDNKLLVPLDDPQANIPRPEKFIFGSRDEFIETGISRTDSILKISLSPSQSNSYFKKVEITVLRDMMTLLSLKIWTEEYGVRYMTFIPGTQNFSVLNDSLFKI